MTTKVKLTFEGDKACHAYVLDGEERSHTRYLVPGDTWECTIRGKQRMIVLTEDDRN